MNEIIQAQKYLQFKDGDDSLRLRAMLWNPDVSEAAKETILEEANPNFYRYCVSSGEGHWNEIVGGRTLAERFWEVSGESKDLCRYLLTESSYPMSAETRLEEAAKLDAQTYLDVALYLPEVYTNPKFADALAAVEENITAAYDKTPWVTRNLVTKYVSMSPDPASINRVLNATSAEYFTPSDVHWMIRNPAVDKQATVKILEGLSNVSNLTGRDISYFRIVSNIHIDNVKDDAAPVFKPGHGDRAIKKSIISGGASPEQTFEFFSHKKEWDDLQQYIDRGANSRWVSDPRFLRKLDVRDANQIWDNVKAKLTVQNMIERLSLLPDS